jgi:outer membrane murein-binding lipoprotein Lpp
MFSLVKLSKDFRNIIGCIMSLFKVSVLVGAISMTTLAFVGCASNQESPELAPTPTPTTQAAPAVTTEQPSATSQNQAATAPQAASADQVAP